MQRRKRSGARETDKPGAGKKPAPLKLHLDVRVCSKHDVFVLALDVLCPRSKPRHLPRVEEKHKGEMGAKERWEGS